MSSSNNAPAADDSESLSALFDRGFSLHRALASSSTSSNDPRSTQDDLRKSILILEDATRLVSVLDVFSRNERVHEVPADHLKYFLLPVLLGDLHGRLVDEGAEREEVIRIQEVYYRDFLQRCNDYGISSVEIAKEAEQEEQEGQVATLAAAAAANKPDMARMTQQRETKLRRYREQKELERRLDELRTLVENRPDADQDAVREFFLKTIAHFVNFCVDELASFAEEKAILRHMRLVRSGQIAAPARQEARRPLRPIVIARDAAQKEVFGMGYKNLPVYSVDEFYDKRVREGWYQQPQYQPQQQQGGAATRSLQGRTAEAVGEAEDEEAREKEDKEERDDEGERERKRNWDEYKDEHRRGDGNRHNMG